MKIRRPKSFSGDKLTDVVRYLANELSKFLNDAATAFSKLSFTDNFPSYEANFTVAAGATVSISHGLGTSNLDWIVARCSGDNRLVDIEGWKPNIAYLKNVGSASITARVYFFRRS